MMLANIGGVQLILIIIGQYFSSALNEKKAYLSILKKFFQIKTRDPVNGFLEIKEQKKNIYKFKL